MPHTLRCRNTFGSHLNTWPCPSQNVKHGSNHFIRSEWMKDGIQSCQGVSLRRAFVSDESCLARLFSYLLFAVEGLWLYAYPGQSSNSSQCFSLRKKNALLIQRHLDWIYLSIRRFFFFFIIFCLVFLLTLSLVDVAIDNDWNGVIKWFTLPLMQAIFCQKKIKKHNSQHHDSCKTRSVYSGSAAHTQNVER